MAFECGNIILLQLAGVLEFLLFTNQMMFYDKIKISLRGVMNNHALLKRKLDIDI